ncbi:hypothetical protein VNO80_21981 [Phaseolus coccineus]|uniref:Uncharacterized protein n=1 Tax=Phaseolus coccineus TaxID=3886 RepID=A0AAN9QUI0_PHACN
MITKDNMVNEEEKMTSIGFQNILNEVPKIVILMRNGITTVNPKFQDCALLSAFQYQNYKLQNPHPFQL